MPTQVSDSIYVHLTAKDRLADSPLLRSPLQRQLEEVGKTIPNEALPVHLQTLRPLGSVEQKDALWEKTERGYNGSIEPPEEPQ